MESITCCQGENNIFGEMSVGYKEEKEIKMPGHRFITQRIVQQMSNAEER